jgi:hypothetical protein
MPQSQSKEKKQKRTLKIWDDQIKQLIETKKSHIRNV